MVQSVQVVVSQLTHIITFSVAYFFNLRDKCQLQPFPQLPLKMTLSKTKLQLKNKRQFRVIIRVHWCKKKFKRLKVIWSDEVVFIIKLYRPSCLTPLVMRLCCEGHCSGAAWIHLSPENSARSLERRSLCMNCQRRNLRDALMRWRHREISGRLNIWTCLQVQIL